MNIEPPHVLGGRLLGPSGEGCRFTPGGLLYSATAANSFGHAVERRVLPIDWIVRIIHQVFFRGRLIGARLRAGVPQARRYR
jgi:hypothetical protein